MFDPRALEELNEEWSRSNFDFRVFPSLAFEVLKKIDFEFSYGRVLDELANLPAQYYRSQDFGELPITLWRNERFFLDMYIWNTSDTSIHDHNFCGAFKVVGGESLHKKYKFHVTERPLPFFSVGSHELLESRRIKPGFVEKIDYKEDFIHQVLHLTYPTVTLCLRTLPTDLGLAIHTLPGFSYELDFRAPDAKKTRDLLGLHLSRGEEGLASAHAFLAELSVRELGDLLFDERLQLPEDHRQVVRGFFQQKHPEFSWLDAYEEGRRKQNVLNFKFSRFKHLMAV